MIRKFGLVYTFPDGLRQVYSEVFGIDLPTFNGDDSWTLPMPARFIVDQKSIIRTVDVNLDHTIRPEPDATIEALKNL